MDPNHRIQRQRRRRASTASRPLTMMTMRHRPSSLRWTAAAATTTTIITLGWCCCCWMMLFHMEVATAFRPIMDFSGKLHTVPGNVDSGIVSVVTSPGMPAVIASTLHKNKGSNNNKDGSDLVAAAAAAAPLGLMEEVDDDNNNNSSNTLVCQGASLGTVSASDEVTSTCLALCGAVSECMVLEGITLGDVDGNILNSRHARTLAALFRVRLALQGDRQQRQTLILVVTDSSDEDSTSSSSSSSFDKERLDQDLGVLFRAAALEQNEKDAELAKYFDVRVVTKPSGSSEVLSMAHAAAKAAFTATTEQPRPLAQTLQATLRQIREAGLATAVGLDAAQTAQAFVAVLNSNLHLSGTVRAKSNSWKNRIKRGLLIDGFGRQASNLRRTVLSAYDTDTLEAAGLPHVAPHRQELRLQLQQLVDNAITQAYEGQIANLETLSLKRFQAELLKTVNSKDSTETIMDANAASLRKQALIFETIADDLQVPVLGLTKDKAVRDVTPKLNDVLDAFPDSPAAKLKRTKSTMRVINKQRKTPGKRSIDVGVDLVAMLRPDGFGSLQGFAMYQLPGGHSLTFGVQNDADDPSVIAQFGGVRPPLLRFQPKLRFDVEL